jgi:palmitoyltransferase ZDHHC13/17
VSLNLIITGEFITYFIIIINNFLFFSPWVGNDIGLKNHRIFMFFLAIILGVMLLNLYGGITFYRQKCNLTSDEGFWNALLIINSCSPWMIWMILNAWFHLLWVFILTSIQIYQIVFIGMTTNERINRGRYKHFVERNGKSPFHLGAWRNLVEFFQCSCFKISSNNNNNTKKRNWMVFQENFDNGSLLIMNESLV